MSGPHVNQGTKFVTITQQVLIWARARPMKHSSRAIVYCMLLVYRYIYIYRHTHICAHLLHQLMTLLMLFSVGTVTQTANWTSVFFNICDFIVFNM